MSRRIGSIDHNSSPGSSTGRRPIRRIRDHSDTQRSLQEASVALENAFDHIRHVRHNLLRLAETFPEPLTTGPSNSEPDSVDPGHEALVLSGGATDEQEQDVSNTATGAPDTPEVTSTPPRPLSPNHATPGDHPTLTRAPLPSVLPPRFSRQNLYGLPALSPDSAATTHGLHVAAREAGDSTANSLRVFRVPPRGPRATALEYERLLARGSIGYGVAQVPPFPDDLIFHSATRERPDLVPSSLPVFSASVPSNVYQYPVDSLMATRDPSNRLQYLPLPPVPLPGRPIQRPSINHPGPLRPRLTTTNIVRPSDVSLNENSALTEHQFMSWLFPSQEQASSLMPRRDPHNPDTIRILRANAPTPSHPDLEPRRRGWGELFFHTKLFNDLSNLHFGSTLARLDADGNEIPWDEEEELERSRTEYRLRVLQRGHEDSNGPEILRHDGRTFHGSVLDSMLSVPATRPRTDQWRPATTDIQSRPFWVDPLPMPLSSMIMKEEHQDDCHPDVIVPRHACLAGR
jgi:hypothetical protein